MGRINHDTRKRRRVGLIFDDRMCKHSNPVENDHLENPNRIRTIWDKLNASGLAQRCIVLNAKEAEDNHLALVHSKEHIELIKTISSTDSRTMSESAAKFDSIYFNEGTSEAAYLAAGSVIEAAEKVAKGELDSAFAIVRPPGHHAEEAEPMGFCLYNNVAIAASFLLNERQELGISKILIVDWDVHHGNSTQKMFYKDPRVLFFSVHRHDSGRFYPCGNDGSYNMIGEGPGAGYNINVPWENACCGDADYFAVWDHILIPVAKEFDPDMIIISAGFDAAVGDPLGGCCLSPYGYSIMLDKLMDFAKGKIVLALEGGYDPVSLANSTQACIEVLLKDKPLTRSLKDLPLKSTVPLIQAIREASCAYWPVLGAKLPEVDIGVGHDIQNEADAYISSLQVNSKVEQVHTVRSTAVLEKMPELREDLLPAGQCSRTSPFVLSTSQGQLPKTCESDDQAVQVANEAEAPLISAQKTSNPPQTKEKHQLTNHKEKHTGNSKNIRDGMDHVEGIDDETEASSLWKKIKNMVSEDDIKRYKECSAKERKAEFIRLVNGMGIELAILFQQMVQDEKKAALLVAAEKKSRDEVARLRMKIKKLKAAWKRAAKALNHEITTGDKFLKSEVGKQLLKKAKNDGVNEFKKSEAFHSEILDAASHIRDEAIKLIRQRLSCNRHSSE